VRAGRLLTLLQLLQRGDRVTAAELARALEVSERTVLRDIEVLSGSGIPVYATRGPGGGFQILDTYRPSSPMPQLAGTTGGGQLFRVRVMLSPEALQYAIAAGVPHGWRPRPTDAEHQHSEGRVIGSFRFGSVESAVRQLLALGPEVEVLLPLSIREKMAEAGRQITALHSGGTPEIDRDCYGADEYSSDEEN
jgi:predicted DNA-binding transcriptional regulator YafY